MQMALANVETPARVPAPPAMSAGPGARPPAATAPTRRQAPAGPSLKPNLVDHDTTLAAISEMAGAKTLAGVVTEVITIANSPRANVSDMTAALKQDPVMSARVLQLAGSAAFAGTKSRMATVEDAVRAIGAHAVRDLALTVGIFDAFPPKRADGLDLLRCWQHAFAWWHLVLEKIVPQRFLARRHCPPRRPLPRSAGNDVAATVPRGIRDGGSVRPTRRPPRPGTDPPGLCRPLSRACWKSSSRK